MPRNQQFAKYVLFLGLAIVFLISNVAPAAALKGVPPGQPGIALVDANDIDSDPDTAIFKGTFIEYGVYKNGCFGTHKIPSATLNGTYGLHGIYLDNPDTFGFAFDIGKDGWDVGTPYPHSGDLFVPGTPYESWGITFTLNGVNYAAGCKRGGAYLDDGSLPSFSALGSLTKVGLTNAKLEEVTLPAYPDKLVVKQTADISINTSGGVKADAVKIEQFFIAGLADSRIIMLLNVINNSGDPMTNLTYMRSVDADPRRDLGLDYNSLNTVTSLGPSYAEVRAFGGETTSDPMYNIGIALGAVDPQAVAHHGFDPWQIDTTFIPANPVTVGTAMWADNAMAVQIPRGSVATGATGSFESYYELDLILPAVPSAKPRSTVNIISANSCQGLTTGGAEVILNGQNFLPKSEVRIGGTKASCTYINSTKVVCTMPPATKAGPVSLVMTNDNGTDNYKGCQYVNALIPETGFAQGQSQTLPAQPSAKQYHATSLKLNIPSLGVSASIVGVPASDKSWDVTWLGKQAGYLAGSAFPTWVGNSVLTGHVWNADNTPGIFANLKSLKFGDRFTVDAFGSTYTYEVRENKEVKAWDSNTMLKHYEDASWLTLVTCEDFNQGSGTYANRRLVRAVLVSVQ